MKKNISAVRGFVHSAPALVVDSTGQAEPALRPMDDREVVRWVLENGEKADDGILANKTKEQKFLVSAGVEAQRRIESAEEAERARQATEAAEKPPRKPAAKIGATAKPDRTAVEKTVAEKATKAAALVADFKNFLKKGEPNDAEVVLTELRQATIQAGLLRVLKGSIARRKQFFRDAVAAVKAAKFARDIIALRRARDRNLWAAANCAQTRGRCGVAHTGKTARERAKVKGPKPERVGPKQSQKGTGKARS